MYLILFECTYNWTPALKEQMALEWSETFNFWQNSNVCYMSHYAMKPKRPYERTHCESSKYNPKECCLKLYISPN